MGRDDKRASEPAGKRCAAFRCGYGAEKPAGDRRGSEKVHRYAYPRLYRPHRGILQCGMRLDEASQRLEY